ncbi:hypothetical protein Ddc_09612 [Ditylenchus destructor]|nr:hypothetical protein Ddc_09612 [Ditylenchus destructor]
MSSTRILDVFDPPQALHLCTRFRECRSLSRCGCAISVRSPLRGKSESGGLLPPPNSRRQYGHWRDKFPLGSIILLQPYSIVVCYKVEGLIAVVTFEIPLYPHFRVSFRVMSLNEAIFVHI